MGSATVPTTTAAASCVAKLPIKSVVLGCCTDVADMGNNVLPAITTGDDIKPTFAPS